jgi:hypothetical protein
VVTPDNRVVPVADLDPDLPPAVHELLELPDGLTRLASLAPAAGSGRPIETIELAPNNSGGLSCRMRTPTSARA